MNHTIVPAELEHALALAPRLRKADLREIAASTGEKPEDSLVLGVASSKVAWTWLYKGRVMAIFGVAADPNRPGVGIPWLLAAKGADRHKVYFVRNSKKYLKLALDAFPYLENYIDCRNTASIQWLAWMGFALCEVVPFAGIQRIPFIRFAASRPRQSDV